MNSLSPCAEGTIGSSIAAVMRKLGGKRPGSTPPFRPGRCGCRRIRFERLARIGKPNQATHVVPDWPILGVRRAEQTNNRLDHRGDAARQLHLPPGGSGATEAGAQLKGQVH